MKRWRSIIHRGEESMNCKVLRLILGAVSAEKIKRIGAVFAIAILLGAGCSSLSVYAAQNGDATLAGTSKETALTMNTKNHTFSNASDGLFHLSYAQDESYYIATAKDSDTYVTYAFIQYGGKFYLVGADNSADNLEYNGSYTYTSFDMMESQNYDPAKRKVTMSIDAVISGKTTQIVSFTYSSDYSLLIDGVFDGVYYAGGQKADGICLVDGNYNYYVDGVRVEGDGWYNYGENKVTTNGADSDIAGTDDNNIKCVKIEQSHVMYTYAGRSCYRYSEAQRTQVKSTAIYIENVLVMFDKSGRTADGLMSMGSKLYYCENGVPVKSKLKKFGKKYYYFCKDGSQLASDWKKVGRIYYYFSSSGVATKRFFTAEYKNSKYAGRMYVYSGGKWKNKASGIVQVAGKHYYFSNGKLGSGKKWLVKSDSCRYYVKDGLVMYKVVSKGIRYTCYVSGSNGKMKKSGKVWLPAYNNVVMHIASNGISDVLFYRSAYSRADYAGGYFTYSDGCWNRAVNTVRYVQGRYYYFNENGMLIKKKGWYTINPTCAAYVGSKGNVTKYVKYYADKGRSMYKTGTLLNKYSKGLRSAVIDGKTVYYYSRPDGVCDANKKIIANETEYVFDNRGQCLKASGMTWNYNTWMKRVLKKYLGTNGIYCNVFVADALRYAGGSDASTDMAVRYKNFKSGGIVINSANSCSYWANGKITADVVVSDGDKWGDREEYVITKDREAFSYDALQPGDVIVYYLNGSPNHVGIYLGEFETAQELKSYLKKLGVSSVVCEAHVHDWGSNSGNKPQYWILQGGMGSSNQVYISNSAYNLSGQIAKKIIHVRY